MLLAGAVLALQGGAMLSVLKNLEAAQNFLGGMGSLSSYGPLEEKQAKGMLRCIEKAQTMAPAQAAAIVHALDVSLWTAASVERFKCALAERTGAVVSAAASMQDFQNVGEFLTVELGEQVLGRVAARGDLLEKLCAHAARLSLRCPTELTQVVLITLAHWSTLRAGYTEKQIFDLLQQKKGFVKRCLQVAPPTAEHLTGLPATVQDLPPSIREGAFGQEGCADLGVEIHEILRAARLTPLRATNIAVLGASHGGSHGGSQGGSDSQDVGDIAAKVVAAAIQNLHAVTHQTPTGCAGPPAAPAAPLLALEDGKVQGESHSAERKAPVGVEQEPAGGLSVEEQLRAFEKEPAEAAAKKPRACKGMKRPARKSACVVALALSRVEGRSRELAWCVAAMVFMRSMEEDPSV